MMSKPSDPPPNTRRGRRIKGAVRSEAVKIPHRKRSTKCRATHCHGAPSLVEVGFDHGRRLYSLAHLNPDWQILGLEVRQKRVEEAEQRRARERLENLKVWRMDARTVFVMCSSIELWMWSMFCFQPHGGSRAAREAAPHHTDFLQDVTRVLKLHDATYRDRRRIRR